jgi:lysophospholipase L1-like esterase
VTAVPAGPFVRGCAWGGTDELPYPRADPNDLARLPGDTVAAASVPAGVRLELVGDAEVVELTYTTRTDTFGYRGPAAGTAFTVVCGHAVASEHAAVVGDGSVTVPLPPRAGDEPVIVYLPEGMRPTVHTVRGAGGTLEPAPPQPRWLAYGDSIVEGWVASGPVGAWPAVAGRTHGLDVVNLGYAGAARGEIASAEQLAALAADVISISHGTNCWTRVPFSVSMFREHTRAFIDIVRDGHPTTPLVVTSPVVRPDAEDQPNRLGATLADLRSAMEAVTRERIDAGDGHVVLVEGGDVLAPELLPDGVHPGDDGHRVLASAFGGAVAAACRG